MVFFSNWMKLTVMLLAFCAVRSDAKQTTTRKPQLNRSVSLDPALTLPKANDTTQKAIIAIEIVNPKDNSTQQAKGRKRTNESALGYGYNSNSNGYENLFNVKPRPPKYEVYKYSQYDIPAYKSHPNVHVQHYQSGYQVDQPRQHAGNYEVQKSIEYNLGSAQSPYVPKMNLEQFYRQGATLFTSLDQNGHLTSLSSRVPRPHGPMVPVIIFRVYTNQLAQTGGLHPNIPNSHPYAKLNNVDLQRLLAGYVRQHQQQHVPQTLQYHHVNQVQQQAEHPPVSSPAYYQQLPVIGHQQYGPPVSHDSGLLTNENYPDEAHTKVIFRKNKVNQITAAPHGSHAHQEYNDLHTNQPEIYYKQPTPQKFRITVPENVYSKVEVQEHTYNSPGDSSATYSGYEQNQYTPSAQYSHNQQYEHNPQYYHDHAGQQEYQKSEEQPVQYDAKQYVQIAYDHPTNQEQHQQQQHQQQQVQIHQNQQHREQQQEVLSQEYYQQNAAYHQNDQQYQAPENQGVEYFQQSPEQPRENAHYSVAKESNDAGRDVHPKVYNYHAHSQRSTQKRKRERKSKESFMTQPETGNAETLKTSQ